VRVLRCLICALRDPDALVRNPALDQACACRLCIRERFVQADNDRACHARLERARRREFAGASAIEDVCLSDTSGNIASARRHICQSASERKVSIPLISLYRATPQPSGTRGANCCGRYARIRVRIERRYLETEEWI